MLLYYFYNMAQVIRKYDWGGNIDYAPIKIYGTYYDPAEFDKEVSRRAQEYAQNGNYSGEKWQKFQSSVEAMKKGLMNGTITMTGDGKFTGAGLNSIWDEDAGRFFYKNLVDNGFKSTHIEPQKYNLMDSFTIYVNDTYGNNWNELDEFDEKTGLRGTTNRSAELKKWLTAERNKLNSDISYRRNYSYKGTDSDVANWATRHNLTVQDIDNILYALEDNKISNEENKTLPIGLNLNQFLSTGKDSEYHRTFIANQEAKAKQVKQEQQAKRTANNVFTPRFYGETPSTFSWDGTDYTMENISQLTDPEALKTLQYFYDQLHNTYSSGVLPTGLDYKYSVNLNSAFPSIMDNEYNLIKVWNDHPAYMDKGSFYIVRPNGNYIPVSNIYEDNGSYWADITNEDGSIQSLSLGAYTNPTASYTSFTYNPESYKGKYVISKVLHDDKGEFYEIINTETKQKQTYRPKGESMEVGTYIFDDDELNKKVKKAQRGTVITFNDLNTTEPLPTTYQASLPSAGFTDKSNQHEEFMSGQELRDTDYARLGASIADLTSTFVGLIPGAHFASTGVGVLSSLAEFGADIADLTSDRPGAQGLLSSTGELALNLGMDLVSLIPEGKSVKAVSTLRKLAGFVPHIAGAIQTGMIFIDPSQRKSMSETLTKLNNVDITNINEEDIRNLTFISRSLIGGYKLGKSKLNSNKTHTSKSDTDVVTGQAIKDGKVVGEIEANVDHSAYNKKFGFINTNKKTTQAKAVESKYKSDIEAKAKADVEQSMQKNDGESDADFKARKDAEIKKRVDEALKDVEYKIKNSSTLTSRVTFENGELDTPRGNKNVLFSDAWFAENTGFGRRYYGNGDKKPIENKQPVNKSKQEPIKIESNKWNAKSIRETLNKYNGFTDELKGKSDKELEKLFPNREAINTHLKKTHSTKLQTANDEVEALPKITEQLIKKPKTEEHINGILEVFNRPQLKTMPLEKRIKATIDIINKQEINRKAQYTAEHLENRLRNNAQRVRKVKRQQNARNRSEKRKYQQLNALPEIRAYRDYKKRYNDMPYDDYLAAFGFKQGGVIRKYQNSGQFATLMVPDPYKTKLYDPNILNKFNNDATNWAESYLSAVNSNSTTPQLGLTKEESDKLLVGNTAPVINNYDPIKKAEAKGYAEGLASVIKDSTIDSKQVTPTPGKNKYTFNPDMPTAYRLASLATNIFGNIAQTRKLIDNYKPFTRQAVQLPHVPVTGDYISLQAGQTQAGNIRTAAKNASQSTSDARLGIASELTGNTQAVTPVMQATAADIAARKQSQAISQDIANKNLISAIETANQNAFEYNKAHNYKTQLESQLIGLTAKNTDNFLKEMQMKSEQIDAMMKETEYKRRATDLSKTFENDLTKYANDNYLAKAKQYLTSKGTDISGMSNSSILDEYFKNNTLAYEEYQNYVNSQKNLFNSQLNNLQLEIYKGKPLLTVEDFLNTDKRNNPIYGNSRRVFKKGGSVREKAVIQQIKDRNKDKLETKKSNAKSLRNSDREFNKTYRHLSAGTLALLKKAME